jgi:hypothetical protein
MYNLMATSFILQNRLEQFNQGVNRAERHSKVKANKMRLAIARASSGT